jgi:hypothetical protein
MDTNVTFEFSPYKGVMPLSVEGLRTHVISVETGNEFLLVPEVTNLPSDIPMPLREVLLGRVGVASQGQETVDVFQLPNDYLTLSSVLNDAVSSVSTRASNLAHDVFYEIGHSLSRIHQCSSLVPESLSYEDIIIERDVDNFKILPPIEFVELKDKDTVRNLGGIMLDELTDNAGNSQRRLLVTKAFEGFWESLTERS